MTGEPTYYQYEEIGGIQINEFDSNIRRVATKVIIELYRSGNRHASETSGNDQYESV
ncbi:MAG: hypothetical protein IJ642_12940 [Oscillospiraceae bacterium]|nr:hypothetical protein [Oscillospiraceae bacterium]